MAEWKDTCNLPRTAFSMKANLQTSEPETIARWDAMDLYGQIRGARKGAKLFLLHDGPPYANGDIHIGTALNKILKDLVVKSHNMLGFDAPYLPGWDCHGLPIELKVDRELGPKKRQMSTADFRRACRAYAEKYVDIQRRGLQAPRHHRAVGRPLQDDGVPLPGGDRPRPGPVRRAGHGLQGQEARPLVHALPDRAGRSRGGVRAAHLALDLRRVPAETKPALPSWRRRLPALAGQTGVGAHLDDHALDHPVEPGDRVPSGVQLRRLRGRRHGRHRGEGPRCRVGGRQDRAQLR